MLRKLKNHSFSKLLLGNTLGQVVGLALYPYIARFYAPEDFSEFGFMVSLTVILGVFATGQIHTALLNPESEEEANDLIGLSTTFVTISSIVSLVVFLLFFQNLWPVSLYLLVYGLHEIQKMYFVRQKAFSSLATFQVLFRVSSNAAKLLPVFVSFRAVGLIFTEIASLAMIVAYGFKKSLFHTRCKLATLKKYSSFPLFQTITMAINLIVMDFPILFWVSRFSKEELGYYVMGQKLLVMPFLVMSGIIYNSVVHSLLTSKNPLKLYLKIVGGLVLVGSLGSAIFYFVGGDILVMILGEKWLNAKEVLVLLSLLISTKLICLVTNGVFVLKEATKVSFISRAAQLIALFGILTLPLNFLEMLKLYILLDIVFDVLLTAWAAYLIKPPFVFRRANV